MSSILKVDTIQDQSGNNIISEAANVITIGASGDTITVPAGATVSGFTSAGIDDNATSTAITISSGEDVTFTENILLGDNKKAKFGTGNDLEIFHDGSNSNISDVGTGGLILRTDGTQIAINKGSTENMAKFITDGAVELYHNNVKKFETTSAGATVTGATTITGNLTVDTNTLFVDSSNNKVGIGTASPQATTEIVGGTGDIKVLRLRTGDSTAANNAGFDFNLISSATQGNRSAVFTLDADGANATGSDYLQIVKAGGSNQKIFFPSNDLIFEGSSEHSRITSAGNLLVGTTSTTPATGTSSGNLISSIGRNQFSSDSDTLELNRHGSSGIILSLRKDGTRVGSLETVAVSSSGRLVVKSTTFDGFLDRAGTTIAKWMSSSFTPGADNTFDLGRSASERWKDIYLSGGAFIGGTGTANKLDDYEEGSWTPSVTFGNGNTGVSSGASSGSYTKVGRLVNASGLLLLSSKGSSTGHARITGLPFTAGSGNSMNGAVIFGYIERISFSEVLLGLVNTDATTVNLYEAVSGNVTPNTITNSDFNNSTALRFTITYQTN